jgi:hypothetical protein
VNAFFHGDPDASDEPVAEDPRGEGLVKEQVTNQPRDTSAGEGPEKRRCLFSHGRIEEGKDSIAGELLSSRLSAFPIDEVMGRPVSRSS